MTTTLLDRVPVEKVSEQARQVQFGKTIQLLPTGLLFGVGWVLAKSLGVAWLGCAWCFTAARLGWRDARGNKPSRASLREENLRLREALARLGG